MMDSFRNFGQSWLAKVVMILIALSFVLWGMSGYLLSGDSGPTPIATVNGQKITEAVYQNRLKEAQARYTHIFGAAAAAKMAQQPSFGSDVLNGLIDNLLLGGEAAHLDLQVPDAVIAKKIEANPDFQEKGTFSKAKYLKLLAANGMTPTQFEGMLRESLRLEQLQVIPQVVANASNQSATEVWGWSQEFRDIRTVDVADAHFVAQAQPSSAAVSSYYQAHQHQFALPAQVRVQYIILGPENFAKKNSAATSVTQSGVVQPDAQAENAFQGQVENFKDRLFSSTDGLTSVAKAYHLKVQESGVLTEGQVTDDGPFANVKAVDLAFSKAVLANKNSSALTLPHGNLLAVHLIHYQPGSVQALNTVQKSITATLTTQKAAQLAEAKAKNLLAVSRKDGKLQSLTDQGLYPLQTHLDVTRRNPQGLPQNLLSAAFDASAPTHNVPSMGMVRTANGYTLFAVTRVTAPSAAAINPKVTAEIRASLEEQRGRLLSTAYLQNLRNHAKVKINQAKLAAGEH